MNAESDWLADPFFEQPICKSIDGGATSDGALWHAAPPRWGHSMHAMCSYHGMFPAKLVHYFVQKYSDPGNVVLDPFSGRGTTALQARVERRRALSNDLNPLAYVLTVAKSNPPHWGDVMRHVDMLEHGYRASWHAPPDVAEDIRMLFHPNTLSQLVYLRDILTPRSVTHWSSEELMLAGADAPRLNLDRMPPAVLSSAAMDALDACRRAREGLIEYNANETLMLERLLLHLPPAAMASRVDT